MSISSGGFMNALRAWMGRAAWVALSVPVHFKVLGIGFLIAGLLSTVTLYQVHRGVSTALHGELRQQAAFLSSLAARDTEAHLAFPEAHGLNERIEALAASMARCVFITVEDEAGRVLAAAGEGNPSSSSSAAGSREHAVVTAQTRVEGPTSAVVTAGVSTAGIEGELRAVMRNVVWWLAASIAFGAALALGLTRLLVLPIRELVTAASAMREGEYGTRARVYSNDEIGKLARAFNELGDALEARQREVEENEAARAALVKQIVDSLEAERKTLARNLHDNIGQSLSHLLVQVQGLGRTCRNTAHVCNELRGLIDETRKLAWDFRPSILDDYGLELALKRYVQEHCAPMDIGVECECVAHNGAPPSRLPAEVETTLYRIAQEAITNVIRHAGARNVSVVLMKGANEARLLVEDDGQGFEPKLSSNGREGSLGLMGMRERAQLLGGGLVIDSQPGRGTSVCASVFFQGDDS